MVEMEYLNHEHSNENRQECQQLVNNKLLTRVQTFDNDFFVLVSTPYRLQGQITFDKETDDKYSPTS